MSLDLYLPCPCCNESTIDHLNITHNVRGICQEAGVDPWEWEEQKRTALSVVLDLDHAIEELHTRPEHYRQWEPANRWGTVEDTRDFLGRIRTLLARMSVEKPNRMEWTWRVSR